MRNRWSKLLLTVVVAVLLVGVALALAAWFNRPGVVSLANYERIRPGMTVEEVERLLGGRGVEVTEKNGLPQVVDHSVPLDHPKRLKSVVSGERCLSWGDMGSAFHVIVSVRNGVVAEKWCWEPSL